MEDGVGEMLAAMWMAGLLMVTGGGAWMFGFAGGLLAAGTVLATTAIALLAADTIRRPR